MAEDQNVHLKHPKIARHLPLKDGASTYILKGFQTDERVSLWYESFVGFSNGQVRSLLITDSKPVSSNNRTSYEEFDTQFGQSDGNSVFDQHLAAVRSQVIFKQNNESGGEQVILYLGQGQSSILETIMKSGDLYAVITETSEMKSQIEGNFTSRNFAVVDLSEVNILYHQIIDRAVENAPILKGLVLAGGKSVRMKHNKAAISYHGKPQAQYVAELLDKNGIQAHISVAENNNEKYGSFPIIEDRFVGLGPLGAICSAFLTDPSAAWFVLACDLPFIDSEAIETLKQERAIGKLATSFSNSEEAFPEPLISIYEPYIYQRLLRFLSLGYACPRKVLINSDIKKIVPSKLDWLRNVNTPQDFDLALKDLKSQ